MTVTDSKISALDLRPGESAIVVKVLGETSLRKRLNSMGIVPGAKLMADKVAPMGDPRSYIVLGYQISLRKDEARQILINKE